MNPYYLLVILAAFLNTIANLLIKNGANKITYLPKDISGIFPFLLSIITNFFLIAGLTVFGIGFLVWVLILNKVQLSIAAPIMSFGFIFITILSYFLLKEPITVTKIAGVLTILLGVIIITR